jgi:hypothetical protein
MESKTGEWIEKGRKNGSSSYIRVIIVERREELFIIGRVVEDTREAMEGEVHSKFEGLCFLAVKCTAEV